MFLMIPNVHVQVKDVMKDVMADLQQTNSEKILLSWVRQNTRQYPQVSSLLLLPQVRFQSCAHKNSLQDFSFGYLCVNNSDKTVVF